MNKHIIRLQAWFRMIVVRRKMNKQYKQLQQAKQRVKTQDLSYQAVKDFVQTLRNRKQKPEEFFRAIDLKSISKVSTENFIQSLLDRKVFVNRAQATRLAAIIDEDFSGDITIDELKKTLKAYEFEVEITEDQSITVEQVAIINVLEQLKKKNIDSVQLFTALDVDNNMELSPQEISKFISSMVNEEEMEFKKLKDKDIKIFINFMDIDRNGVIQKGEFLKQYTKLENLAQRLQPLYKKEMDRQSKLYAQRIELEQKQSEEQIREIVQKMQKEGVYIDYFIHHLQTLGEQDNSIKLGILLKQMQISYPTITGDQIRQVLRLVTLQSGRYNILELQIILNRFVDEEFKVNSLFQTLLVISEILKYQKKTPLEFLKDQFINSDNISYELFNEVFQTTFQLPIECVIEFFNSLIVDQNQLDVKKEDVIDVINSFYFDSDKLSLNNVNQQIENFDKYSIPQRKAKIVEIFVKKLKEKKLQPINLFKISTAPNAAAESITKVQLSAGIAKVLPYFTDDLLDFIFNQQTYSKDQFLNLFAEDSNADKTSSMPNYGFLRILDQALLQLQMSPSLLFKQADINKNGRIDLMELKQILMELGQKIKNLERGFQIDEYAVANIMKELDINGNGQLDEQEFYQLIKIARNTNQSGREDLKMIKPIEMTYRSDLLPLKGNLKKIMLNSVMKGDSDSNNNPNLTVLTDELAQVFDEIEKLTPIKSALAKCPLNYKLFFNLRDLSIILKQSSVSLQTLVHLYRLLDTSYQGKLKIQTLLPIVNDYLMVQNKKVTISLELQIICKVINIYPECLGSVEDFFTKHSKFLGEPDNRVDKPSFEREFLRIFKINKIISNLILDAINKKFLSATDSLRNRHIHHYIQLVYNELYPKEQSYTQIHQDKKQAQAQQQKALGTSNNQTQEILNDDKKRELLRKFLLSVMGRESGFTAIKSILEKYGFPDKKQELIFQDFYQIFVEDYHLLDLNEAKVLFQFIIESSGTNDPLVLKSRKHIGQISSLEFLNFIGRIEQQIVSKEVREITKKIEDTGRNVQELMNSNVCFILQDSFNPRIPTTDVLKFDNKLSQIPDASRAFAQYIMQNFPHPKKQEFLLDLYEYLALQISDSQQNILSSKQRYQIRQNKDLRDEVIQEMIRQRPQFQIYKIMDDLPFSEDGIIPNLGLKNHIKKLYPYLDETKIRLFVQLVDINSDNKIEIQELFRFFNEIYDKQMSYSVILTKLAQIVHSTNETVETFFRMHLVDTSKISKLIGFQQFVEAVAQIFRISKYEAYIIFAELKLPDQSLIDFRAFLDCLQGEVKRLMLQDQALEKENNGLELKIENYKNTIAQKIRAKLLEISNLQQKAESLARGESQDQGSNRQKQSAQVKLTGQDILRIFLENYQELNNTQLLKKACLNLQTLIKCSPRLRAQFLTNRVCLIDEMYDQLGKDDPNYVVNEDSLAMGKVKLLEQEKIILCIIANEDVKRPFPCNIFGFTKMIKRLNERSSLDFQILHKILEQKQKIIQDLLQEDLLTIQGVIEQIRKAAEKLGQNNLIQFNERTSLQELISTLTSVLGLKISPNQSKLIARELQISKSNHFIEFARLKIFLAQCSIRCDLKENLTLIFDSYQKAKIGLQALKQYLIDHPYLNINEDLVKDTTSDLNPIDWHQTAQFDKQEKKVFFLSKLHDNNLIHDCILQMNSDQHEKEIDHINSLILDDKDLNKQIPYEFMIIRIHKQFVICDKRLPFSKKDPQNPLPLFSFNSQAGSCLPYVEKALATYLGGYEKLKGLQSIYQIYQYLNYDKIDIYSLKDKASFFKKSHRDLVDNYFQKWAMRNIFFKMPATKKKNINPLALGLEGNRVYSVIGVILLQIDTKTSHSLLVIHNPYISEDPRKSGELWSKQFLNNPKKNAKIIEMLNKQYDSSIHPFLADTTNNAYTYDIRDILQFHSLTLFSENAQGQDLDILIQHKLSHQEEQNGQFVTLRFSQNSGSRTILVKKKFEEDLNKLANGLVQFHLNENTQSKFNLKLNLNSDKPCNEQLDLTFYFSESCNIKLEYDNSNEKPQVPQSSSIVSVSSDQAKSNLEVKQEEVKSAELVIESKKIIVEEQQAVDQGLLIKGQKREEKKQIEEEINEDVPEEEYSYEEEVDEPEKSSNQVEVIESKKQVAEIASNLEQKSMALESEELPKKEIKKE